MKYPVDDNTVAAINRLRKELKRVVKQRDKLADRPIAQAVMTSALMLDRALTMGTKPKHDRFSLAEATPGKLGRVRGFALHVLGGSRSEMWDK